MKLKKLLFLGMGVILCAACNNGKSGNQNELAEAPLVEPSPTAIELIKAKNISASLSQLNLEFWPTCTADEIAQFVLPKLETVIMNETGDESLAGCFYPSNGIVAAIKCEDKPTVDGIIAKAKDVLPKNVILLWSAKPLVEKYSPYDDTLYEKYYLYAIKDDCSDGIAPLQGDFIKNAEIGFTGRIPHINIKMNDNAAQLWADMTEECALERRPIAIVANRQVLFLVFGSDISSGDIKHFRSGYFHNTKPIIY